MSATEFPVDRVARALHRMKHPTWPRYQRCGCLVLARKLAEYDRILREHP